jgi:CubicO group peptidase (beta-lactamase class C family)
MLLDFCHRQSVTGVSNYNERFMTHRITLSLSLLAVSTLVVSTLVYAASDELRSLVVNRVDQTSRAVGLVVGTIDSNGREVVPYGKLAKDRSDQINGDTIFEIGSVTQVFTSLLLADMVERDEVKLETPVADLLPASVKVPMLPGKKITLLDLSMHLSGLPRMPANMAPKDLGNIYADYTPARLDQFLSGYTLTRNIGETYEFSNVGAGLLGYALSRKAGMSYEQLLRKRILEPLGMENTAIVLSAEQKTRLAAGYDPGLDPAKNWDFDVLAGAGALHSTANDLLKFLAANLELTDTPLKAAMRRMRAVRHKTIREDIDVMLGWHVYKSYGVEIVWQDGSTAGYWAFLGFDPDKKVGSVALSNTYLNIDDVGLHAIAQSWPVTTLEPRKQIKEIKLDAKALAKYTGEYRFSPNFSIKVVAEDGHLYGYAPTQPRFELLAAADGLFFLKALEADVAFVDDDKEKTMVMYISQKDGKTQKGRKVH